MRRLCWLMCYGGVYASANLRGGGEYGVEWRNAGSLQSKQVWSLPCFSKLQIQFCRRTYAASLRHVD